MDGQTFANIIEAELAKQKIAKGAFYEAIGVTAAAMWGWKNGAVPKPTTVKSVEDFLGINFAEYETSEIRETLRDDLRILLRSAEDLPPSSVYALISQIEKEKEKNVQ